MQLESVFQLVGPMNSPIRNGLCYLFQLDLQFTNFLEHHLQLWLQFCNPLFRLSQGLLHLVLLVFQSVVLFTKFVVLRLKVKEVLLQSILLFGRPL